MECTCVTGLGNTGVPNCQVIFDVTKKLILVPYFKEDGTINGIDLTGITELDQAFIDGKIQALNPDDRWYPTPEIKNIEDVRGDDIVETFEDSTTVFIQEGPRTFLGLLVGQSPTLKGQLDKWRCETIGAYFIDKSKNFIGDNAREGFLDPVKIQKDSLSVRLEKGTDTTFQKVAISFTVDQLMDDANLSFIGSSNITGDLAGSMGLLDVVASNVTTITTTGFKVDLRTLYGGVISKGIVKGFDSPADYNVFNVTQNTPIVLGGVSETPDGTYEFTYPPVAASDLIRISNKTTGTLDKGYDLNEFAVQTP